MLLLIKTKVKVRICKNKVRKYKERLCKVFVCRGKECVVGKAMKNESIRQRKVNSHSA